MNFTEFWSTYPAKSQHKGSKANAEKLWNKLNVYDKHAVEMSLQVYENHLHENPWKNPMMVQTYLGKGRHWESFQPPEKVQGQIAEIEARREKTRRLNAWQDEQAKKQWRERYAKVIGREP